jgi:hypothetical protein
MRIASGGEMPDHIYGSLEGDLRAADIELNRGIAADDIEFQQRACAFALSALAKALPMGNESRALSRMILALQRVIDGRGDPILLQRKSGRTRASPERNLDALAVLLMQLYAEVGVQRGRSFALVAKKFGAAGMTTHGGGRQADSDHSDFRAPTPGSIKALWNSSRPGKPNEKVGIWADKCRAALRKEGVAITDQSDVENIFKAVTLGRPSSLVELLTSPPASESG